jgi:peroxiredoxin Q/BCP
MAGKENSEAIDFSLFDDTGTQRKLSDYRGKPVVLYFYPKDDTPGCSAEACNFRDDYSAYEKAGITILGISPDSVKSHLLFKQKYHLPFVLLSDPDHKVCNQYGAWGFKRAYGKEAYGVLRTTFLIDGNGKITKIFKGVDPKGHSGEVINALKLKST